LLPLIIFAYKFVIPPERQRAMAAELPKWVSTDSFDIEARAPITNPSKDQMRLMMQSLLAERFGLALHFETRAMPVLALVVANRARRGQQLIPHSDGPPCPDTASPEYVPQDIPGVFPQNCETYG